MLLPSAVPSAAEAAAPLAVGVGVRFDGPLRGRLELRVSGDVARCVAENMLGVDALDLDADGALVRDALGEVANVVCGNLLPEIAGRDAVFRLDAPRAFDGAGAGAGCGHGTPAAALSLGVDGGRAELALHLE